MWTQALSPVAVAGVILLSAPGINAEEITVTVAGGDWDRTNTVVTFQLPGDATDARVLEDADGNRLPLQVSGDARASFILSHLRNGEEATYRLVERDPSDDLQGWVEAARDNGRLRFSVEGVPSLYYQAEERPFPRANINPSVKRGGFLHPVMSPSGRTATSSYPPLHAHHQGIWAPWTRTEFQGRNPDFWNMHAETGKVEFTEIEGYWSGPVHGGFRSQHEFIDLSADEPVVALYETWELKLYRIPGSETGYRLFDLYLEQETATSDPVTLLEHHYGGLGFRGHDDWIGEENTRFLTSEWVTDRNEGNGTRTRWTYISGEVDGEQTGIAIFCHPENFRFPQPVRLHPDEPFFCYAPSQLGDWEITPDEPYTARYRFAVIDGDPDLVELERLWNDYAHPPEVRVEPGDLP